MSVLRVLISCAVLYSASTLVSQAQSYQPEDLASAAPTQHGVTAKTVFVSNVGGQQADSAAAITAMHNKLARQGWTVIDVAVSKKGFFVTYVKQQQKWTPTDR